MMSTTTSKITGEHTEKLAYVYVRQSTMGQVRLNQESTQRQYALKERARTLGWQVPKVVILDKDLGESGTQMSKRGDFQRLIAEVSLGRVGAVLALEASRLSRSCADWHRLLELCALTCTLIIDEDGCYDPRDFNDQLLLGNPCYAGCYAFGRYGTRKTITESGEIVAKTVCKPMEAWEVLIEDHHYGYITWEQYLKNQEILKGNCSHEKDNPMSGGAAREGAALLQGLLICGRCGRRLTVRYGAYPQYECNWHRREGLASSSCLSTRGDVLDQRVGERVLEAVRPMQIEIALEAAKQLAQRDEELQGQWELRLQRAEYQAQLAERNYRAVDATNRLVASTLERQWNEALEQLADLRDEQSRQQQKHGVRVNSRTRDELMQLAKDLPRVWQAPSTSNRDRKRLLRLLIKDITVERTEGRELLLHIRWQGGACENLVHQLPPRCCDKWRYPEQLIDRVRELALEHRDDRIAAELNDAGYKGSKDGKPFSASMVRWIRHKHCIAIPSWLHDGELSVDEVAERFNVSRHVVYYWIGRGYLSSRQPYPGGPHCLMLTPPKQKELAQRAEDARLRLIKLGN